MNTLISIIIPVYNVEKYLRQCLDSVLSQTYKSIELILIDDGSTDSSGKICDEYANMYSQIKVVHQNNAGLSAARNAGIKLAKGDYIGFVDSDDKISPLMYEKLLCSITEEGSDMSICDYLMIINGRKTTNKCNKLSNECIEGKELFFRIVNYDVRYIVAWNKLYKKDLFLKLKFPVGKIHEDEFLAHRIAWKCTKVSIVSDSLYYYRVRNNSITQKPLTIQNIDGFYALYDRYRFIINHSLKEYIPIIVQRISRAYVHYICAINMSDNNTERYIMNTMRSRARNIYHRHKNQCDWKTSLAFLYPKLFFYLSDFSERIRKKCFSL